MDAGIGVAWIPVPFRAVSDEERTWRGVHNLSCYFGGDGEG
jgi:hypothetical protein